ncbi:class F sortase [Brachybacterium sacelli]|uniref:Sortase (Surface protein transpeptidase) n=1 Tax=Brachybacterium sacelli TaxID=173364 RepID=A0ABS4WX99_9MICO|nr:class F sortase [Brachybacterium sacelli]MBP2380827.1 sortase (surface protein transpeptidase) [Brachybacterium sacelli]
MTSKVSSRRGGGRRVTAAVLAVLALVGAALLVFSLTSQVGAPPEPELRSAGSAASDGGGAAPEDDASSSEPTEQPTAEDETTSAVADPLAPSEPTSLRIPSLGVDERVFPIGLGENGELLAPRGDRAHQPAWFEGSPTPGENGPSVIEGHVTWGEEPSVFFELGGLETGDRLEAEREDGTTATFEVYDSARYPKDEFPTLAVYGRTQGPELRLITCGGDLGEDGHHLDNTVVFARLVAT